MINLCYCFSEQKFEDCCQPLLSGDKVAENCVELMRSRYSAFCTFNIDYLQSTMSVQSTNDFNKEDNEAWAKQVQFTKLTILKSSQEQTKGQVEFIAEYIYENKSLKHHEISYFRKESGYWKYKSGKII